MAARQRDTTENISRRMVSLGHADLRAKAYLPLAELRTTLISLSNQMVDQVWRADPLTMPLRRKDLDQALRRFQNDCPLPINKAYLEKAREQVFDALVEQEKRFFKRLVGRLHHCDADNGARHKLSARQRRNLAALPEHRWRLYANVPHDLEQAVTPEHFAGLKAVAGSGRAVAVFRDVVAGRQPTGFALDEVQRAILAEIHIRVLDRFRKPVYNAQGPKAADGHVVQLFIDYRTILGDPGRQTVAVLNDLMDKVLAGANEVQFHDVVVSNPAPRQPGIPIKLVLYRSVFERLNENRKAAITTFALELGPERLDLKAVLAKVTPEPVPIEQVRYVVGRDFGFRNTLAHVVVKLDKPIDVARLRQITEFGKEDARAFLRTHGVDTVEIVHEKVWSGKNFLARVDAQSTRIEKLSSQIDGIYNRMLPLRKILGQSLGLETQAVVPREEKPADRYLSRVHTKFFVLLDHVQHLKALRRSIYRSISGLKKAWLCFLANTELALADHYGAAVAREDLTVLAKEKGCEDYKGRVFNRMMNNGAKGKFIRWAPAKLEWFGIPEIVLPSYYTSTTCILHRLVDKKMRKGDVFYCPACSETRHADLNAGLTLALYPVLEPIAHPT
mgnify:CR=1 FL=1